jgi:hypothetical protein
MTPTSPAYDPESDIAAWTVGSGILLTQAFALFPGLLPCLVLLLPLVLPVLVLGLLGGLFYGMWRLGAWALRALTRSHFPVRIRQMSDAPH